MIVCDICKAYPVQGRIRVTGGAGENGDGIGDMMIDEDMVLCREHYENAKSEILMLKMRIARKSPALEA